MSKEIVLSWFVVLLLVACVGLVMAWRRSVRSDRHARVLLDQCRRRVEGERQKRMEAEARARRVGGLGGSPPTITRLKG